MKLLQLTLIALLFSFISSAQISPITGPSSVCNGNCVTLSDVTPGGTWSSSNTAIAPIGSATGVVCGVSSGVTTITYTVGGSYVTFSFTDNPTPAAISGPSAICTGSTGHYTDGTTGGSWSSSDVTKATIGSSSGIATGVASGTAVLTYTLPTGCYSTMLITVNANPVAITGSNYVCVGYTTTLSDFTPGGTWSSSNPSVASVGAGTGVVTGVAAGTVNITYTLASGCFATMPVFVNSNPAPITGPNVVCVGSSITLGDVTPGGTWSVSNTGIATIGFATAALTGVSSGVEIVSYTLPTGCVATYPVTVNGAVANITGGASSICVGGTTTFSDATPGGTWSSSNTTVATINASGIATGVGAGTTTISYSVSAGCYSLASLTVLIASPTVYTVGGSGAYCAGSTVSITLSGSQTGANYQLYNGPAAVGTPLAGTGSPLTFSVVATAGTYTVVANAGTSCATSMSGSAVITVNPTPTVFTVTGGSLCAGSGVTITPGLTSTQTGVSYQLLLNGTPIGSPIVGAGGPLLFAPQSASGVYTVVATNLSTGCTATMSGNAILNAVPTVCAITGGGSTCTAGPGVSICVPCTVPGIVYQYSRGGVFIGGFTGGSTTLCYTTTTAGAYTVVALNTTTGCSSTMTGTVNVTTITSPTAFTVTGGGAYCAGGTGVTIGLSGSQTGVTYTLFRGTTSVGTAGGTGSALSFGTFTTAGTYTIVANYGSTCSTTMTGSAVVSVITAPTVFNVTGGGSYCGATGLPVGLSGSQTGVSYQLYDGATPVGSAVAGTGSAISFGLQTAGTYTVVANPTTACSTNMSGSAVITVGTLPTPFSVTGGGTYCTGGAGVPVGLSGSQSGIIYTLYNGVGIAGTATGTGSSLSFGAFTAAGTYTVIAGAGTSCAASMTGSATITVNPTPTVYAVTGGGSFCAGGTGVAVGSTGSQTGVTYQLYNGTSPVGSPVAGTGSAISFGLQTTGGTYTVVAEAGTACATSMSGSAIVTVNPLPNDQPFTSAGSYCTGGTGVSVGLTGSDPGVSYQLRRTTTTGTVTVGSPVTGTGSAISFGLQTIAGLYTVVATNTTTGCTFTLTGSTNLVFHAPPAIITVTGGGGFCAGGAGVAVTLPASATGVSYQLYRGTVAVGSPVLGTGTALSLGLQTVAGTYTVIATDLATGCTSNMSGSAIITVYPAPTSFTVTGGGSFCPGGTGVAVGLSGSASGVNYQLYRGSVMVGSAIPGSGLAIGFGMQSTAGTYTVVATNASTMCSATMSGSAVVALSAAPIAYAVTGGGAYCSGGTGSNIGLANSDVSATYQLYRGTTPVGSSIAGSGTVINFGPQTVAGTYTVIATSTVTGCTTTMTGSVTISINPLPTLYTVTGGGSYCSGAGPHVMLSGSNTGISYQLYRGGTSTGSPVAGTSGALDFGAQSAGGTYTVVATNTTTGCAATMTGSATVTVLTAPGLYTVTGGGAYCMGGSAPHVVLSGSHTGVSYQLYRGTVAVGTAATGTGSILDFGPQGTAGTYTVVATLTGYSCTTTMTGSATVAVNPLPGIYTVTGGGTYCLGGSGVAVGLSGSATGVTYQLYNGTISAGSPVAGTGAAISFGLQTVAGTYTVKATSGVTGCTNNMAGSITVGINALPTVYTVTGGGAYCSGGSGVAVGLSGSTTGIHYQLYRGTVAVGSAVVGTGGAISFGLQTVAGTYTVVATNTSTGCSANMTGSAVVTVGTLPTLFTVSGGGAYCAGGTGVAINLSGSQTGVSYQLYRGGTTAVGSAMTGTGSAITTPLQTVAGTYTIVATNGCTRTMSGSAMVTVNPLPVAVTMTGGGSYCSGGAGVHVGLSGSVVGTQYQLLHSGVAMGGPVSGVGGTLDFGLETSVGIYIAIATNPVTGCTNTMTGSVTVTTNPLPATYTVTGGGSFCSGGSGVHVYLSGSVTGVNYRLYIGATPVGTSMAGTGSALDFGLQTTAGTYTAVATNATTGCTSNMSGSAVVVVNPLPNAGTISGPATVHNGFTITLTDGVTGGVWSSSNTSIATVGSGTGVVTGVSAGFVNMTYSVTNVCGTARAVFTVHELGPQPPAQTGYTYGNTTICVNGTTTLVNTVPGGAWSSGDERIASVDAKSGVVTGVGAGIVAVTYTLNTVSGMSYEYTPVVVNATPDEVTITGVTQIAKGKEATFTATVANGAPVAGYQWLVNSSEISDATKATFVTSALVNNDKVTCRVNGECGGELSSSVTVSVGAENVTTTAAATDIKVIPNPSKGNFRIMGTLASQVDGEASINICDVLGKNIYHRTAEIHGGVIDEQVQLAGSVANGMYLLTISSGSDNKVFHIVVEQ